MFLQRVLKNEVLDSFSIKTGLNFKSLTSPSAKERIMVLNKDFNVKWRIVELNPKTLYVFKALKIVCLKYLSNAYGN